MKFLKKWRHFILCDQFFNDKSDGPGHLLFIHEWHIKLLEALYLILLDYKENGYRLAPASADQLGAEQRAWRWFPQELADTELANPYLAINKVFKKISLPKFRDYLKEWVSAALYKQQIDESMRAGEVVLVFDSLQKLYGAAWLIRQRYGNDTESKAIDDNKAVVNNAPGKATPDELKGPFADIDFVKTMHALCPKLTNAGRIGLDEVKALILREVPSVCKIILLGTFPKPFTYYLLIIVDDSDKTPEHEIANKIEDNSKPLVSVFAIVHKAAWASQEIANGDRFWNTAMYRGIQVYTSDGFTLPAARPIANDAWIATAKSDRARWGHQGLTFLTGAKRYIEDEQYGLAAFLLHQAVESSLIGILRVLSGYRTSSHNLARMLRLTLLFTSEIIDVLALDTIEGSQLFELLQSAYSAARYKTDFLADGESVELLSLKVEALLTRIKMVYLRIDTV